MKRDTCVCLMCDTFFESDEDLTTGQDDEGYFRGCPNCNTDHYLMDITYEEYEQKKAKL